MVRRLPVFLLSVAFCAYTVFGYPLLLGLLARRRARPVHKAPWRATVSVILPVHNGERWIGAKLESIRGLNYPSELMEIIRISDASRMTEAARSNRNLATQDSGLREGAEPPTPRPPPWNT